MAFTINNTQDTHHFRPLAACQLFIGCLFHIPNSFPLPTTFYDLLINWLTPTYYGLLLTNTAKGGICLSLLLFRTSVVGVDDKNDMSPKKGDEVAK